MAEAPRAPQQRGGALTREDADRLRDCMAGGGVAVFGADTVYGLCCDPGRPGAVARLYELKGRPAQKAAAVMFFDLAAALAALPELGARERAAATALLPGPVTLLLGNPARRFPAACGEDPATLGLRVPLLGERCAALAVIAEPVMQSSANISGEPAVARLADVPAGLLAGADLVLDGGELPGTASTVIDLRDYAVTGSWRVLRAGALSAAEAARRLSPGAGAAAT